MGKWTRVSDFQQVRSDGDTTLTIEQMDKYWRWSVTKGGQYVCDDEVGDYAHSEQEAKILAEFYSI